MPLHKNKVPASDAIADPKQVITKAVIRLAENLQLTRQELSNIIGVSEPTLSRIFATQTKITEKPTLLDPADKAGELSILLIRLYVQLDAIFGGNLMQCRLWLRSENTHLNAVPIDLLSSIEGLTTTIRYLEMMGDKT